MTTYVFHRVGPPTEDHFQHSIEQINSVEGLKTFDGVHKSVWTWADKLNLKGSVLFVCGDFVGKDDYCDWNQLMDLVIEHGCELGWHSWSHRDLTLAGTDVLRELESPIPMFQFAYPYGEFTDDLVSEVAGSGYARAFSTTQGNDNPFSLRREYI